MKSFKCEKKKNEVWRKTHNLLINMPIANIRNSWLSVKMAIFIYFNTLLYPVTQQQSYSLLSELSELFSIILKPNTIMDV